MNFANKKPNHLFKSFTYAWKGIKHVFKNERNFRIHIIISVLVLFFAVYFRIEAIEIAILIISISMVLVAEMINSAIEYTWDKLEPNHHPVVGVIKDTMAGSVLLTSFAAVVVGLIIIFRNLI
jgi:diacylglycerol kinase